VKVLTKKRGGNAMAGLQKWISGLPQLSDIFLNIFIDEGAHLFLEFILEQMITETIC
jgi:hypothetical protein